MQSSLGKEVSQTSKSKYFSSEMSQLPLKFGANKVLNTIHLALFATEIRGEEDRVSLSVHISSNQIAEKQKFMFYHWIHGVTLAGDCALSYNSRTWLLGLSPSSIVEFWSGIPNFLELWAAIKKSVGQNWIHFPRNCRTFMLIHTWIDQGQF